MLGSTLLAESVSRSRSLCREQKDAKSRLSARIRNVSVASAREQLPLVGTLVLVVYRREMNWGLFEMEPTSI